MLCQFIRHSAFLLPLILVGCARPLTGDVLIAHANIVDIEGGVIIENQYILIKGDSILSVVGDSSKVSASVEIDARGKFLIPGLWDMHTHNFWDKHYSEYYVGNGVLGVRNMYTPMSLIAPLRDSIDRGLITGPYYVSAGRVIEGPDPEFPDWLVVDSPEKIGPALDSLINEGSDFVKVYNKIPADIYFDLVREATRRGLPVEGHVPMAVSALDASNAGQRSIEHLLGIPALCTDDSLFAEDYGNNWFRATMQSDDLATLKINEKRAASNFAVLRANDTYVCPTLVVWHNYLYPDEKFEEDGVSSKFTEDVRVFWFGELDRYRSRDSTYKVVSRQKYSTMEKLTYLLYHSGVPMLTGSDAINPCVYPGFALHRELLYLKNCGIPDADVLRMATINAVRFLHLEDQYGQIREGHKASLVLLNGNPLHDITQTSSIETVIHNGRVYYKEDILKMLN